MTKTNQKSYQNLAEYHYLFQFYAGLSKSGAGVSGELYATDAHGKCKSDYLSSIVFFAIRNHDIKHDYCMYGIPSVDFREGKLYGDGYGCTLTVDGSYCNPHHLPITFRLAHQKEKILQSWSRI